jgi:hypothetical protein
LWLLTVAVGLALALLGWRGLGGAHRVSAPVNVVTGSFLAIKADQPGAVGRPVEMERVVSQASTGDKDKGKTVNTTSLLDKLVMKRREHQAQA